MTVIVSALTDPAILDAQAPTAPAPQVPPAPLVSAPAQMSVPPPSLPKESVVEAPLTPPTLTERRPSRAMAGPSAANETTAIAFNRPAPAPEPELAASRGLLPVMAAAFGSAALAFGLMYLLLR